MTPILMNPLLYASHAKLAYVVEPDLGAENSSCRVIIRKTMDGTALIFRGSDNIESWITDLNAATELVDGLGNVHSGFYASLNENIDALMHLNVDVVVGHSLGGALAILYAAKLCLAGKPPKAVFAYEPPRVSTDATIAGLLAFYGVSNNLYRNGRDLVTQIPEVPLEDWQHSAPLIEIGDAALLIDNIIDHEIDRVIVAMRALVSFVPSPEVHV